jgi:hypothetical protein
LRPALLPGAGPAPRLAEMGSGIGPIVALLVPMALLIAPIGPNPWLVAYAFAVLGAGLLLTWRRDEPPIMTFIFCFQWLQAALGPIYGNLAGMTPEDLASYRGNHTLACFLLLTGTLVLAAGMRLGAGRADGSLGLRIRAFVALRPLNFWVRVCAPIWLAGSICESASLYSGPLSQVVLALAQAKWAAFVLLTFATFGVEGRSRLPWLALFFLQFLLSLGGYFSSFKEVFFYAMLGLAACQFRLSPGRILGGTLLLGVLIWLGIVWSAVKVDYRDAVNGGTGDQVVTIGFADQLGTLRDMVDGLDGQRMSEASEIFARRIMYYEFCGVALNYVPAVVRHTDGALWADAFARPLMPRILFPEKTAVHDSELTNAYTGLSVTSYDKGTSISMGYMTEAYIDFGEYLMFGAILVWGCLLGLGYRLLTARGTLARTTWGAALACSALMPALALESSMLKVAGGYVVSIVFALVLARYVAQWLDKTLMAQGRPGA